MSDLPKPPYAGNKDIANLAAEGHKWEMPARIIASRSIEELLMFIANQHRFPSMNALAYQQIHLLMANQTNEHLRELKPPKYWKDGRLYFSAFLGAVAGLLLGKLI